MYVHMYVYSTGNDIFFTRPPKVPNPVHGITSKLIRRVFVLRSCTMFSVCVCVCVYVYSCTRLCISTYVRIPRCLGVYPW